MKKRSASDHAFPNISDLRKGDIKEKVVKQLSGTTLEMEGVFPKVRKHLQT